MLGKLVLSMTIVSVWLVAENLATSARRRLRWSDVGARLWGEKVRRYGREVTAPVPLLRLRAAIEERGASGYLLTVSDDASPHAVHAPVRWDGDVIVADVGKRSAANAVARPAVSLL